MSYTFRQQSYLWPQTDAEGQVRFERFQTRKVLKQVKALAAYPILVTVKQKNSKVTSYYRNEPYRSP